jgi:hypothetical protein
METGEQETIEREEAAARVKIHKQNSKLDFIQIR